MCEPSTEPKATPITNIDPDKIHKIKASENFKVNKAVTEQSGQLCKLWTCIRNVHIKVTLKKKNQMSKVFIKMCGPSTKPKLFQYLNIDPNNIHNVRAKETFKVNRAVTWQYRMWAISYCKRLLNQNFIWERNATLGLLLNKSINNSNSDCILSTD